MTDAKPIAFKERESCDPHTGEPGTLRTEWRLIPFNRSNPIHYDLANQRQSAGRFSPTVVLEHRYVRRGKIEPWQVFDGFDSETLALESIPHDAIVLDCPPLMWIQHERKQAEIARREEQERLRLEADRTAEEVHRRNLSHQTWIKMYNSPRDRPLCDEWDEFANRPAAIALRDHLKLDTEFMRLYRAAVDSTTVPSKRSAIRACVDYYAFMWKHRERKYREPNLQGESQ